MPDLYSSPTEENKPTNFATPDSNLRAVHFDTQDQEETIILLLRRHWATNSIWMSLALVFLVAPLLLRYFPLLVSFPATFQIMAVVVWYLLVTAFIFEEFLSWYFNVYIVTDQRIIDYDFYSLLYKSTTDADIERIQDVSVKMGGVAQVMFNYGDILIETAGALPNLEFEKVPNPAAVAKLIHELRDQINSGNKL